MLYFFQIKMCSPVILVNTFKLGKLCSPHVTSGYLVVQVHTQGSGECL